MRMRINLVKYGTFFFIQFLYFGCMYNKTNSYRTRFVTNIQMHKVPGPGYNILNTIYLQVLMAYIYKYNLGNLYLLMLL